MQTDISKVLKELGAHTVCSGYEDAGKTFNTPQMYVAGTDSQKAWETGYKLYAIEMRYDNAENVGESGNVLGKIHEEITHIFDMIKDGEIK
jgi:hypothetical protein